MRAVNFDGKNIFALFTDFRPNLNNPAQFSMQLLTVFFLYTDFYIIFISYVPLVSLQHKLDDCNNILVKYKEIQMEIGKWYGEFRVLIRKINYE